MRDIGDPEASAHAARIVHIDVETNEIGKTKPVYMDITADPPHALWQLLEIAMPLETSEWQGYLKRVDLQYPLEPILKEGVMTGASVIACLPGHLPSDLLSRRVSANNRCGRCSTDRYQRRVAFSSALDSAA
ncbi:hypothetical protein HNO52_05020 [Billgrantia diversa]|uniref:hypothetical protein n=1 Tax=Halomonas sp. MCCC 1A13316 TaxID=2733487 RepID=UPI0018A55020|nr:hypothetical protein [Halomonas sp. MCCC 1A13316]QOR37937.1 hypothetical protein HNO52_05020 [Halomonas sp. MCCC 1A13316]